MSLVRERAEEPLLSPGREGSARSAGQAGPPRREPPGGWRRRGQGRSTAGSSRDSRTFSAFGAWVRLLTGEPLCSLRPGSLSSGDPGSARCSRQRPASTEHTCTPVPLRCETPSQRREPRPKLQSPPFLVACSGLSSGGREQRRGHRRLLRLELHAQSCDALGDASLLPSAGGALPVLGRGSRQVGLCGPERRAGALLWTREAPTPHVCRTGAHLQKAGPALTLTRRLTPQLFNIYPWLGALLQLHRPVLRKIAEVRGILRPLLEARRASAARGGPAHSYVDALIQQGQVWARHIPPAAPQRPQRPGPHSRRAPAGPGPQLPAFRLGGLSEPRSLRL